MIAAVAPFSNVGSAVVWETDFENAPVITSPETPVQLGRSLAVDCRYGHSCCVWWQ